MKESNTNSQQKYERLLKINIHLVDKLERYSAENIKLKEQVYLLQHGK